MVEKVMQRLKNFLLNPHVVTGTLTFVIASHYITDFMMEQKLRGEFYPLSVELFLACVAVFVFFKAASTEPSNTHEKLIQYAMVIGVYVASILGFVEIIFQFL